MGCGAPVCDLLGLVLSKLRDSEMNKSVAEIKKTIRDWFRDSFASYRTVFVFYSVYIFIFSYYSTTRCIAFYYWLFDGKDYEWILLKSPLYYLLPISVIIGQWMFLQAVFIIYAQSKTKDAFLRGHLRYLIQTFWLVMVIWGSEIILFKTPLGWVAGMFVELIRGILGGLYVVALYRMIRGLMALKNERYPSAAANLSVSKERSLKTYLLLIPLFFVIYWFAKWGSWYFVRPFYHPEDTHVLRVVTTEKTDVPIDAYIKFRTTNNWCQEENPISGTKLDLYREIKLAPGSRDGYVQDFRYDPDSIPGGWCGWKFKGIYLRDSRKAGGLGELYSLSQVRSVGLVFDGFEVYGIPPNCWLIKAKERWFRDRPWDSKAGVLDESEISFCH